MKVSITLLTILMVAPLSFAASGDMPPPPDAKGPKEKNPALEKALEECSRTAGKDEHGRPDRDQMDTCMKAKGFTKPPHHPGNRDEKCPPCDSQSNRPER